jgi:hypothetical protein
VITAVFIGGGANGQIIDLPGIVQEWHVPWMRQSITDFERGIYVYRLKYPAKRTIHDYDLKNELVPYVFIEEQLDPTIKGLSPSFTAFDEIKGEQS